MAFGLMPTLMQDDTVLQWWEIGTVAEIDDLKRKLAARENVPGYKENVAALKVRIAELEKVNKA